MWSVVGFLVLVPVCQSGQWLNHIYVDPVNGNNTSDCLVPNNPSQPCKNLSYALQYRNNSAQYVLLPGQHYLDDSAYVNPIASSGVAISANSSVTIECLGPNASIAFIGASNIHLENVTFYKCAGLYNSTSRNFATAPKLTMYQFKVALYFYLCQNVTMSNIVVTESPNATGVVIYDTTGMNHITNSTFVHNNLHNPHVASYPGGGGLYVEFTFCKPGDDDTCFHDTPSIPTKYSSNSNYTFTNCNFSRNHAHNLEVMDNISSFIIPYHTNHEAFGRGGGLSVFFKGNASRNVFMVNNCTFEHNHAVWGGGLFVEFHDNTAGNSVTVVNSNFTDNTCYFSETAGTAGGGMRIGHYVFKEGTLNSSGNRVAIQRAIFGNNSALNGGGLSISPCRQNTNDHQLASILVEDSKFEKNVARLGVAVHVSLFSQIIEGKLPNIQFTDCDFNSNSVVIYPLKYVVGIGTVYVNGVPVLFRGNNTEFIGNSGTALAVVGTYVDFMNCLALFISNTGHKGGAIALLGSAWILINNDTYFNFRNNSAQIEGGALYNKYTEREDMQTYINCFIRHEDPFLPPESWPAYFVFFNNTITGNHVLRQNSIHSTSILPCSLSGSVGLVSIGKIFCWKNWKYENGGSCSSEISSDTGNITVERHVKAIPGKFFHLPLVIRDDLNHNITDQTVFTAASNDTDVATIDPEFSYVAGETLRVNGKENYSFNLVLNTAGDRVWHVEVEVDLQECPPGFGPSEDDNARAVCECSNSENYDGSLICDSATFESKLRNAYWIGLIPGESKLAAGSCPPGFCYTDPQQAFLSLPKSISDIDAVICQRVHRTGVLCGECVDEYGPAVNSEIFECVHCSGVAINALYYVLSVYLPLFLFFTAIIVFNIRLTTGPANAFILYSQVISSSFDLNADGQIPLNLISSHKDQLLSAYQLPYGIFNLEFFENLIKPLCLSANMNALDVIQLDNGIAIFPLLMIILVVVIIKLKSFLSGRCAGRIHTRSRLSKFPKWRMGQSLLHAFAAFVLLSYTKFSLTASNLVIRYPFINEDGYPIHPPRVYFAGQYPSDDPVYIRKYFLPGCLVFAIFIAIPPLLLLEYPVKLFERLINKVHCLRRFYPVDKIHILLDTFQGCYRNNMRFFAGLYFIFRLAINLSLILTDTWLEQYIIQQIACTIMVVLLAICQPYTKEKNFCNYVDIFIFANLAVLNSLSLYLFEYAQNNPGKPLPVSAFIVQYILVFLPLFYMIGYVMWHLLTPYHQQLKCLPLCKVLIRCCERNDGYQSLDNVTEQNVATTHSDVEAILDRARHENTYRPPSVTVSVVQIHDRVTEDSGLRTQQSSTPDYGSRAHTTNTSGSSNQAQSSPQCYSDGSTEPDSKKTA